MSSAHAFKVTNMVIGNHYPINPETIFVLPYSDVTWGNHTEISSNVEGGGDLGKRCDVDQPNHIYMHLYFLVMELKGEGFNILWK